MASFPFSKISPLLLFLSANLSLLSFWSEPTSVYEDEMASPCSVAVDSNGNALIISLELGTTPDYSIRASQISNNTVTATSIFQPDSGNYMAGHGNGVYSAPNNGCAAWLESADSFKGVIRSAILTNSGWSEPVALTDPDAYSAFQGEGGIPLISISSNEHLAIWGAYDSHQEPHYSIYSRLSNPMNPGTWQSAVQVHAAEPDHYINNMVMAGNAAGQGIAVWGETDISTTPNTYSLSTSFYDQGWQTPLFVTDDVKRGYTIPVAVAFNTFPSMSSFPFAIILWNDVSKGGLSSSSSDSTVAMLPQVVYDPSPGTPYILGFTIALDSQKNAIALWIANSNETYTLFTNRRAPNENALTAGSWGEPLALEIASGGESLESPLLQLDASGNALVVWKKTIVSGNSTQGLIYSKVFNQTTQKWGDISILLSPQDADAYNLYLAMNAAGDATVCWLTSEDNLQSLQETSISNLFDPPSGPLNLTGIQVKNRFLQQTDVVNILNWSPSASNSVISYDILRNGVEIASLPASGPLTYQDHNRSSKEPTTYQVFAENGLGVESEPSTLMIP